jgi:hypothetical protein
MLIDLPENVTKEKLLEARAIVSFTLSMFQRLPNRLGMLEKGMLVFE